jgi:chromosome partitioning protein
MTMFDSRTRLANDVVTEVRRVFPSQVFKSVIPRSIRLAEAPSYGLPISIYAPDTYAAHAYSSLALEVLEGDGIHIPELQEQAEIHGA